VSGGRGGRKKGAHVAFPRRSVELVGGILTRPGIWGREGRRGGRGSETYRQRGCWRAGRLRSSVGARGRRRVFNFHTSSFSPSWLIACVPPRPAPLPAHLLPQPRPSMRGVARGVPLNRPRGPPPQSSGLAAQDKPKREAILDLSKYVNEPIRVKFMGGREGPSLSSLSVPLSYFLGSRRNPQRLRSATKPRTGRCRRTVPRQGNSPPHPHYSNALLQTQNPIRAL
jgi:hypothetical protein